MVDYSVRIGFKEHEVPSVQVGASVPSRRSVAFELSKQLVDVDGLLLLVSNSPICVVEEV